MGLEPLPYYRWLVRDYRANRKVQRMGYVARGLYRELLDEAWLEGSLPNDPTALADICGCPVSVFAKSWPEIAPCFEVRDDRLFNKKLEDQRTETDKNRVRLAHAGKAGALAKQKLSTSQADADISQSDAGRCHIAEQSREEKSKEEPPSAGARGEFICATHLQQTLGIPASAGDIQLLAQVVMFEAKNRGDTEKATEWLIWQGRQAQQRGEVVNVFWFKDKRYEEGNGKNHRSPAKQRVDDNRSALADALAARGVEGPWNQPGADVAPISDAGSRPIDGSLPGRLRTAGGEVLATASEHGTGGTEHQRRAEVLPPAGRMRSGN